MNWDANVKEMADTWTDFQRQLWASWIGTTSKDSPEQLWQQSYKQYLAVSEEMINLAMDTQLAWTRIALKSMAPGKEAPVPLQQWFEQVETMTENWNEAVRKSYCAWFTAVKDLEMMQKKGELPEVNDILQAWQSATEKTMDIQSEWASQLMPKESGAGNARSRKTKAGTPPPKKTTPTGKSTGSDNP